MNSLEFIVSSIEDIINSIQRIIMRESFTTSNLGCYPMNSSHLLLQNNLVVWNIVCYSMRVFLQYIKIILYIIKYFFMGTMVMGLDLVVSMQ